MITIIGTGNTAPTYTCENGHTDVAALLLLYCAQLEHESKGNSAGQLYNVQFLVSPAVTNNDHTPLNQVCVQGHLILMEALLKQRAEPFHKLQDDSTTTSMLMEAKGGQTAVVQMLIDYSDSHVNSNNVDIGRGGAHVPLPVSEVPTLPNSKSQLVPSAGAVFQPAKNSCAVSGVPNHISLAYNLPPR